MEEIKKDKIEYDVDDSSQDQNIYNRKSVNNIKRLILFALVVICVVPILLCIYLVSKLNDMEKQIDELEAALQAKKEALMQASVEEESVLSEDDLLFLEQEASDDIEKNTTDENNILSSQETEVGISSNLSTESSSQIYHNYNGRKVYLTFDDGPSIYTDEILAILDEKNVKATFFVVYNEDENLWDEYSSIVEQGHTLGMHSYSHIYDIMYADLESFEEDVTMIHDFLYEQTGVDCTYYRFPGGSSNAVSNVDMQILMGYLYDEGYTFYDWNSLSGDSVDASLTPEQLNANIMGYVRNNPGDSIVLMHDLKNNYATVEALPALIDTLIEEGYEICPIDEYTEPVQHVTYILED